MKFNDIFLGLAFSVLEWLAKNIFFILCFGDLWVLWNGPQSHGTLVTPLAAIRKIPVIWYDPLNSPLLFLLLIYTSWSRTTWVLKLSPFSIIKSQKMIIYTHRRYEINSHIHMYHYIQIRSVKFWVLSYSPVM